MENLPNCPKCESEYTYNAGSLIVCSQCLHEWTENSSEESKIVKDINGVEIKSGDNVTVIKDLKIKGASTTIKRGTKVRNIRITEDDGVGHDIECKFDGVGVIKLKSNLVKKN